MKNTFYIILASCITCLHAVCANASDEIEPLSFLSVITIPDNAEVSINREIRGSSPLDITNLKKGTYLISVKKRNYHTAYRTVQIKDNTKLAVEIEIEPITGLAFIETIPPGADVIINEIQKGRSPLLINDLPIGEYEVHLSSPGYQSAIIPLTINDRVPQRIFTELRFDAAIITVLSEPPGASVVVNGIERGTAPCSSINVPEGESTVMVSAEGYHPYIQKLKLAAGETQEITARLKPRPGMLTIVSIPAGVRIYVDNQFKGNSPVTLENLSPGTYRIRAEQDLFEPLARTVTIHMAEKKTEEFRLTANSGSLLITTEPAESSIFIDGKERGVTSAMKNQTDRVSEPLTIGSVEVGNHQLRVTCKGYFENISQITITRETTLTRHIKLNRRFIPDYEIKTQNRTYTGILKERNKDFIMFEIAPGVTTRIERSEILSQRVLRGDEADKGNKDNK